MNKLKNNKSIPNFSSDIKGEYGKILSTLKPNEFQESKSTKNFDLSLKNKINSSIRENIASLSSDRQQPIKIKKIGGKVETIVELIKQDLLPMLTIQNQRIEKLERKIRVKQDIESDIEQRESIIELDKKVHSVMGNDFLNLSVSVEEVKKSLSSLDNFVKYQFIKSKNKQLSGEEFNAKQAITVLQNKLNTELIQQKIQNQQSFSQIQEYMTLQLQDIKEWITCNNNDLKQEISAKLLQVEVQFYEFMYQPIETIRQLQNSEKQIKTEIEQKYQVVEQKIGKKLENDSQQKCVCLNNTSKQIELKCGHIYHEDCLTNSFIENIEFEKPTLCNQCQDIINLNEIKNINIDVVFMENIYKEQLKQLLSKSQLCVTSCLNCGFFYSSAQDQNVSYCFQCYQM